MAPPAFPAVGIATVFTPSGNSHRFHPEFCGHIDSHNQAPAFETSGGQGGLVFDIEFLYAVFFPQIFAGYDRGYNLTQ
jgi:hypothetical protein